MKLFCFNVFLASAVLILAAPEPKPESAQLSDGNNSSSQEIVSPSPAQASGTDYLNSSITLKQEDLVWEDKFFSEVVMPEESKDILLAIIDELVWTSSSGKNFVQLNSTSSFSNYPQLTSVYLELLDKSFTLLKNSYYVKKDSPKFDELSPYLQSREEVEGAFEQSADLELLSPLLLTKDDYVPRHSDQGLFNVVVGDYDSLRSIVYYNFNNETENIIPEQEHHDENAWYLALIPGLSYQIVTRFEAAALEHSVEKEQYNSDKSRHSIVFQFRLPGGYIHEGEYLETIISNLRTESVHSELESSFTAPKAETEKPRAELLKEDWVNNENLEKEKEEHNKLAKEYPELFVLTFERMAGSGYRLMTYGFQQKPTSVTEFKDVFPGYARFNIKSIDSLKSGDVVTYSVIRPGALD
jgi:hypothetical protein